MPNPTACPHASTAMIAAGILECGTCEQQPPAGFMDDDTSRQEAALAQAHRELADAFDRAASEALIQAKMCRRKKPAAEMDKWLSAVHAVSLAERAVDTAAYDLSTAKGAHG